MAAFFIFILKSAFVLALLVSLFMIFMSRETFHRLNRYIMLSIVLLALLLPAVNLGIESPFKGVFVAVENYLVAEEPVEDALVAEQAFGELPFLPDTFSMPDAIFLSEVPPVENIADGPVEDEASDWFMIAAIVYFLVVAVLVVRQAVMYVQVARIIARSRVVDASLYGCEGISLRVHRGKEKPFSWFRWVVVSEDDLDDGAREILIHETAHARAGHSWDIVLADAVIIMQWFNPLAWIMKNSLKDIHEFEADEAVINSGVNAKQYQLLIIKKAVGARLYSIANSFNHSLTKKRITMMCKEKSKKWRCAKALYIVPVAAIAAFAFTTADTANATVGETLPKGSEFVANNEMDTAKYVQQIPDGDDKVYQVCEIAPAFPGGTHAMYKYLADNIKYPGEAKAAGKQGRVMVQFVIRKDGSISDVTVVKSSGDASLDKEAVRVVSSMPKWNPGTHGGKPVNVQYTLPVQFKLPDGMINNEKKEDENKDNRIVIGDGGVIVDTNVKDNALIVVDGKVLDGDLKELESSSIAHIEVIKNSALAAELKEKYNAKDKEGVIFITTSSASPAGIVGNPAPVINGQKEDSPFEVYHFNNEERTTDDGEKIYQICEIAPEYPGGMSELMKWLSMNVKYPKAARDINGQGKIFVRFVVRADGSISNAEVVKSDFSSDYSEVSLAEQTAKEIEYYKNSIERIENDCKEFEQHIEEWKKESEVLKKGGTPENILNRRREELEKAQKLLEEERAKIVIMKRTLAQKEEMLANSKNELDEIMVTAFKNEKGEALSTDEVMALRAAAEKALKDEAVRVVSAMPKWNPGTQGGKAVNVSFTLPIMFRLQ